MNEEAQQELEALESIYPDLLKILDDTSFEILVESPNEDDNLACRLIFYITDGYPDEAPNFNIIPIRDMGSTQAFEAKGLVNQIIERSLGSGMIFDIIEGLRDWFDSGTQAEILQIQEQNKVPVVEQSYTPVTPETFLKWKQQWIYERQMLQQQQEDILRNKDFINGSTYGEIWSRQSGKEYFTQSRNIEEENIVIDETAIEDKQESEDEIDAHLSDDETLSIEND